METQMHDSINVPSARVECLCVGCGLFHELSRDEIVLEPVDGAAGKRRVVNCGCSACGEVLITDAVEGDDPLEPWE